MSTALLEQEKQILLRLAREAVQSSVLGHLPAPLELECLPNRLQQPGASFVTLTVDGKLRGCIGTLEACRSLAEDVRLRAQDSACRDPRFPPLAEHELAALHIEISVLSTSEALHYRQPEDLPARLRPGVDGVTIVSGRNRATFLPQVWEKIPDPGKFLELLCSKAGLEEDAWRNRVLQVSIYQVEVFTEEDQD